jgi:alpha-glucosidase
VGKVRDSGKDSNPHNRAQAFGNNMHGFNGGAVGNAQFPILYGVGRGNENFALFFDNTYRQRWDLTAQPWTVETSGGALRGFVILGPDLPSLRRDYLNLTGRAPVPPKKAFGLWISEYGFDNWKELDGKLKTLRLGKFPVDGFVLDLQWFGGIKSDSEDSSMGGLTWDRKNFPEPESKIAQLRKDEGLGIVMIEESYISKGVLDPQSKKTVHEILDGKGYLAKEGPDPDSKAVYLSYNPWWGRGGMLDWTNGEAAKFWHDWRRQALVDIGIAGHWTDLGEPELLEPVSYYSGGKNRHADIHNIYNLKWAESIINGYQRHKVQRRPWILSRSGTSGIQRYAAALWSGDIGSNLSSLATHFNAQMHMSFSGVDYFGSDIGGFHRGGIQGDMNEMYTQWFAAGAALDVPVRVHTENLCNCKETAPDRIGHAASNLFNLRQRYELIPYYYSLAHTAYRSGDPLVAPLVFHYQNEMPARKLGDHKLIGKDLLVATIARHGQRDINVYLPKGNWYNYHTGKVIQSGGEWVNKVPAYADNIFRLPMFAREGAIIPKARVDENTKNSATHNDLVVRVYPSRQATQFTLFEDDGETISYQTGAVRQTEIKQSEDDTGVSVVIGAAHGDFEGAMPANTQWIELASGGRVPESVQLNGQELAQMKSAQEVEQAKTGWFKRADGLVIAKAADLDRGQEARWKFELK